MNRKPLAELIPVLAKGIAPTTAVATALLAPLALGASGDLDPEFADRGRLGPILELDGAAWSVEALDGDGVLVGGGDSDEFCYYWYECYTVFSNFAGLLAEDGTFDESFRAQGIEQVEALDVARQADGKVVAAGRRLQAGGPRTSLVVFRLASDGSLDAGFGAAGIFDYSPLESRSVHRATAIALEPDGRIVVAGALEPERRIPLAGARESVGSTPFQSRLIVLRLLANGSLDPSFGIEGAYFGPAVDYAADIRLARTAAGDYRVASGTYSGCQIIGVTAGGALDASFADSGIAGVESASGDPVSCRSLAAQADGTLLVAGNSAGHGFAARLLANGDRDPGFAPDAAVAASMNDATSIAAGAGDKVLVAGSGLKGASIMRLQSTGELDALFGNGGSTWIDLVSQYGSAPVVHDLAVRADGGVLASGTELIEDRPFVIRLVNDNGGESPGVLSFSEYYVTPAEAVGHAVVHVRRSGGSAGDVSVDFHTTAGSGAVDGEDYTAASGTLHWADGDATEREIVVAVADDDGPPEVFESFHVALGDAVGGAGIGTRNATIDIKADGEPGGQIALDYVEDVISEDAVAYLWVSRNFYAEGEVSVTITPEGVTATAGDDFDPDPITITWANGEWGAKYVEIGMVNDSAEETAETFRVELSDPTGGAILGVNTSHVIAIGANDSPRPTGAGGGSGGGGGGAAGFLSLLILGMAELLRGIRRHLRNRERGGT